MPFMLRSTSSSVELKDAFDAEFNTGAPMNHIHGAILNLSNSGFDNARRRANMTGLVIDLSKLHGSYSNIELFFRNALSDGAISFRPDTPIHANDEGRYPGGRVQDRLDGLPRHFEFGAVGGGMRVVFDNDTEEVYISAHYSFPGRLVATAGTAQAGWLETTKARLNSECCIMADHSGGETRKVKDEIDRLRSLAGDAERKNLHFAVTDPAGKAAALENSLRTRASRNKAFRAWLNDSKACMSRAQISALYGL
jgi:hypothetical protein